MEKGKVINWVKQNWVLISIIVFALVIRIYYFIITQGQVLWWDEAEYLNMATKWAFGGEYSFGPVRQVLFPLITAMFLKISNSELLPRLFILGLSMASVIGMYFFGKVMYGKKEGLVASFLMAVFYLNLFFSYRLLVDVASLTFFIFSGALFYKYFSKGTKKSIYLAAVLIAIGTLFKLSTAFILLPCLIYLLISKKLSFLKKKEIWISAGIFVLILLPYIIWGYFEFGGFVLSKAAAHVSPESYVQGFGILKNYLVMFPTYFSWPLCIMFLFGIISMYKIFLYFDHLKKGDKNLKGDLYLLLIFLIPIILISFMVNHNENRYIMAVFAPIILIASFSIIRIYNFIKNKSKVIAIIFIILLLSFTAFYQIKSADTLIKIKKNTYFEVGDAGLWLKENSGEQDVIATKSQPQIRYYSGRKTIGLPVSEEEFESALSNKTKFYMLSIFEAHPEWAYSYPERKNLTAIKAYFNEEGQPLLVIYNLK